jgi:hypothetical protein
MTGSNAEILLMIRAIEKYWPASSTGMLVGLKFRGVEIKPHIMLLAGRRSSLRIVRVSALFARIIVINLRF